ncbi:MAG: PspA/IM30 family protein [Candidatus Promineifilaceae bacterium]|nr:PspA/IM30 family protein [Candidatus Promineifilaceae bacterium]
MGLWQRIMLFFKIRTSSTLDQAEDPRQTYDYAYAQQQELLRKVKQGLIEVATAKEQLAKQIRRQRARIPQLEKQAQQAVTMNREDLARVALGRKQRLLSELDGLEEQLAEVTNEETRLIAAQQQIADRIDAFRTHRDVMSARYTAAESQVRLREALGGVTGELGELSMALGRAEEKAQRMLARATAMDNLIECGSLELPLIGGDYVEQELRELASHSAVEQELAALKAGRAVDQLPATVEASADDS